MCSRPMLTMSVCLARARAARATVPPHWRYNHGGVWVDTDTVLLRDFRPLVEFLGEFATKVTLSHFYNNNVLSVRRRSSAAAKLVDFVCQLPYSTDTSLLCRVAGQPCYAKWYVV